MPAGQHKRAYARKAPKSPEALYESLCFQSLKAINKATKTVKGFLLQRLTRRIKEGHNSSSGRGGDVDIDSLEGTLQRLKEVNHSAVARLITQSHVLLDRTLSNGQESSEQGSWGADGDSFGTF
jgi:hypothetical protein